MKYELTEDQILGIISALQQAGTNKLQTEVAISFLKYTLEGGK